ncbi:MAG: AhpC/TSA family protein [Bacteroidales bacterium]|nr:AhpC/TSA family protein [Bacteroidales bacterium]
MNPLRFLITLLILLGTGENSIACKKKGYQIDLSISGQTTGKPVLALQKGDQISIVDSLPAIKKGSYRFKGQKSLEPGQYMFVQNNRRLFHFLVSFGGYTRLGFRAAIDEGRTKEIDAKGDPENRAYFDMQRFLQDIDQKAQLNEQDIELIEHYTDSIATQYPNTLLAILARNISAPPLPEFMSLHDPRVLHTSILPLRLSSFFTHIVPPQPDKVIPQIDYILDLCTDPLVKAYCGNFLLRYFLSSVIMGMENAAVHVAQKYVDGSLHTDNEELRIYLYNYVTFNESSLIGKTAPELRLPNVHGIPVSLRDIEAHYTILFFYDEDCKVCKEQIPLIQQAYEKHLSKGISVYTVYTQDKEDAWRRYTTNLPPEWIHVWDPDFSSGFHKLYNVTGTPRVFLLDRNKTIIGRELDASLLDLILSHQP